MRLKIEKLVSGGLGLSHEKDGRVILAPRYLPGEEIDVIEAKESKGVKTVVKAELLMPSEQRIVPSCPYRDICGGCDFDYLSAKDSAYAKEAIVKDNLERIARLSELEFLPPSYGEAERWRARLRIHISLKERKAGFLSKRSKNLVQVKNCPRLEPRVNELIGSEDFIRRVTPSLLTLGVNRETGLVELPLFNADDKVLINNEEGVRTIGGIKYHLSASVFFQSNPKLLPQLLNFVKENAEGERIMDLYSGVGTFSALFEGEGKEVWAVERERRCLKFSGQNAPSALSFSADAATWVKKAKAQVDTIIVDPPRSGLDKATCALLNTLEAKKLIYVSCDSVTLSRDIARLSLWKAEKACVFDFYPGSGHEETVCLLSKLRRDPR